MAPSRSPCALHVVSVEKLLWTAQAWCGVQGVPPDLRPEPAPLPAPRVKVGLEEGKWESVDFLNTNPCPSLRGNKKEAGM